LENGGVAEAPGGVYSGHIYSVPNGGIYGFRLFLHGKQRRTATQNGISHKRYK